MWNATQHNLDHVSNHGMNIKTRVIQSNSLSFDIKKYFKPTNKAIMSFQNNMAKESYPYKIIQSGYAPSSPHKVFKSCTTPMTSQAIVSYSNFLNTFSIFTQYMSVSHGYSTIYGIEWWLWRRQKEGRQSHINQAYQRAMEMPSIDINVSEQGLPCNRCTRAINVLKLNKRNQWVCIQLACS